MERSRRTNTRVRPHDKFAELRALRESGKKRIDVYELEQEEDLYEEVDEDEYKKVVRKRLDEDDFVVDDGGEGYVDNGMEDWGDEKRRYDSDEEAEDGRKLTTKEKKRKREEEKERKNKQEGDLHRYFNKNTAATAKPKTVVATAQDKDFLDDLLGEFDASVPVSESRSLKKRKEEPSRKTRKLSPPKKATKRTNFMPSSPPPVMKNDDDDEPAFLPMAPADEDIEMKDIDMSDAPIPPSSPTLSAVKRKQPVPDDDDDDDVFAVAEVKGNKNVRETKVNISSSRPVRPLPGTPVNSSPVKSADIDPESWKSVNSDLNVVKASNMPAIGKLQPQDALEEDGTVKMFWIDYTEVNGALILFGKVQDKRTGKYVSAFLKVDGILRNLYFLPRERRVVKGNETEEEIEMSDVHEEAQKVMDLCHIPEFKAKSSFRKYAFELPNIPKEGDYLKILYPYTKPAIAERFLEGETYSHVFGAQTALFEQFVLCRNIMGPCWLKLENVDFKACQNASWCKLEMQVPRPKCITTIGLADSSEPPPLTIMSIALRTFHNAKENKQEVIAVSCRIYENVSLSDATQQIEKMPHQLFTVVRPLNGVYPPGFEKMAERRPGNIRLEKSEVMLLSAFMAKLQYVDPDVLMGHNFENVDWPVLLHRLKEKKTPQWSRLGRMKRTQWPHGSKGFGGTFFAERQIVSGRLICDLANDLGRSLMTKCQSWSLTEMCDLILGAKRRELDDEDAMKSLNSPKDLMYYLDHCENDSHFITAIGLKVQILPLSKQLTNLAGNSWARTLAGTRAERNEYILLHEFHKNKYICPDKVYSKQKAAKEEDENGDEEGTTGKKKDKYKGGLVFEPEKGLYDKFILVMDFNSLYPSIIQEYNICFTTVDRSDSDEDKVPDVPEKIPGEPDKMGILPKLIATLVDRRKAVKGQMKDKTATAVQKTQWDIKQQALKLTANSMYGCLGYTRSRFYARPLAMLTTFKGREILQATKDLAESMSLQVIYGDTDSVMINTLADNYADAIKTGNMFKREVNNTYRKLEIDIDNVFQRLLLHAKKKYAAMNCVLVDGKLETKMEVKGLDMRRREYCQLSKEVSKRILDEVFTGDEKDVVVERIHEYLRNLATDVREGKPPVMKYTIYTRLGKNPEDYPNGRTMPQVQVALREKARGKLIKAGAFISYIITCGKDEETPQSDHHAAERAYSIQDVLKKELNLRPDPEWYLVKQIFPPIERLCAPIDGTDSLRLAECLGLDTRKYQIAGSHDPHDRELQPFESTMTDSERFKDVDKLVLKCRFCKEAAEFEGIGKSTSRCSPQGIVCTSPACGKTLPTVSVVSQVETQLRAAVARYYQAWLVCDDSACGVRTRQMSVYGKRCLGKNGLAKSCRGVMHYEYTDKMLYNQLLYFKSLFDVEKARSKAAAKDKDVINALTAQNAVRFGVVENCVGKYLDKCGRGWVEMGNIFSFAQV
ncbi:DNA polymeras-like protein alpha catalytic subunit [Ascodesmis nigricans]|uniref:DNA polymerase n=1 Tax=Ascodesmis nigricans TaxID=341454 RepID=A0A4S2MTD0_9PEZI|nr:DNA polymeras-like protein alpha catalytic subunit [Ascodesmis nigricans]